MPATHTAEGGRAGAPTWAPRAGSRAETARKQEEPSRSSSNPTTLAGWLVLASRSAHSGNRMRPGGMGAGSRGRARPPPPRSRSPLSQPIPGHGEVAPKQGRRRDRARTWAAGATAESAAPGSALLSSPPRAAQRNKNPPQRSNGTGRDDPRRLSISSPAVANELFPRQGSGAAAAARG